MYACRDGKSLVYYYFDRGRSLLLEFEWPFKKGVSYMLIHS